MRQTNRIETIVLNNVGPFYNVRFNFPPIQPSAQNESKAEVHIFTGPNGCGKSTVLYAIAQIFDAFNFDRIIRSRFHGSDSSVDFSFSGMAGHYGVRSPSKSNQNGFIQGLLGLCLVTEEDVNRGRFFAYGSPDVKNNSVLLTYKLNTQSFRPSIPNTPIQFPFSVFSYSGQRNVQNVQLEAIRQINNSPFESALSFNATVRPSVLLQWIANNRTQAALARQDSDSSDAEAYDHALARITDLIRDICGLEVEFRLDRSPLAVSVLIDGVAINFDGLPDGLKSIISWVADLTLRLENIPWTTAGDVFLQPVILLLDEVDIHLHPKWQRRILPAVQKLLPNAQIFVSTHSPFVVGSVEDAWVYRLPEDGVHSEQQVVIEGIPSAAGKSYRLIMEEVFGIDGEFDFKTETLFAEFYEARKQFIESPSNPDALLKAAKQIAQRGEEATQIVSHELRQIARITRQELVLA